MTDPRWIDVPGPPGDLKALTWGPPDGPIALCLHGFPDTAYGWRKVRPAARPSRLAGRRAVHARVRTVSHSGRRQLSRWRDDGRRTAGALGRRRHRPRRGDRPRLGRAGGHRPGRHAQQPLRQGGDHVAAGLGRFPGPGGRARPAGPPTASSAAAQLVHLLLPIALPAGAFRPLDTAVAVAAVVAGLSRRRGGSASRRRRDRDTAELAGGAGHVSGHGAQYPAAGSGMPN